jgi:predicted  nucleic acid-binding Zn-ribbon protein
MDCTNCGAAIPPKEEEFAGTCYGCGESLGFQPFVSETDEALDRLEQRVREARFHELAGAAEVADDIELGDPEEGIDFEANRRSLAETHEFFAPVLPIFGTEEDARASASRHPTARDGQTPTRAVAYEYYRVTGNIRGAPTSFWVEVSSNAKGDTSARSKYCQYVSEQGWKLFDREGRFEWPEDPAKRHPAKRRSLDVSASTHDEPDEYLYRLTSNSPLVLGRRERTQGT